MPDATITSTASTFGTITGTFAADQSTVTGTITGTVAGTLTGSVGVPGPAGPGVPAGGTAGQYLQKIDGVDYNTDWVTLNLSAYAPLNSPAFTGNPTAPTAALGDNDTSLATTAFVQQELASGVAVAKNLEVYVRNQTGSTIPAGSIVYISGATGNRPLITLAQANNDANSAQTMGFTKTAIANNGFGYVIVRGELENIDTSALTEGAQLYLSPTVAGTWTTTKPSAPQHLVYVGIVVRAHPTQGIILVAVQNGYELNELHDVAITSPTNGQVLKYNSSTNLWVNGTDSAGVAWGGITGTLSAQGDLQTALDGKYSTSNPAGYITSAALTGYATESFVTSQGYITSAALTPYLTSATAASTYQTLAGMSSYLTTATAASTYAPIASPTFTGTVTIPGGASISGYLTTSSAASTYQTIAGMSSYLTTSTAASTYALKTDGALKGNFTLDGTASSPNSDGSILIGSSSTGYSYLNLQAGVIQGVTYASGNKTFTLNGLEGLKLFSSGQGVRFPDATTQTTAYPGSSDFLLKADNLAGLANTGTARTNLGLGTMAVETASNYLTTATASSTYFTIASAANKADLASPTFTGTPSLPTGTIGVTQTAGNNTTALATTAFVQTSNPDASTTTKGHVQLATFTTPTPTSTTTAVTPAVAMDLMMHPGYRVWGTRGSTATSGAGAAIATYSTSVAEILGPNTATAGYSMAIWDTSGLSMGMLGMTRGVNGASRAWNKPVWASGRGQYGWPGNTSFNGDANCTVRVSVGGKSSAGSGDISTTEPGFGFKFVPGSAMILQISKGDASALTNVTSSFTPTVRESFDWKIYSDGAGNVTLYINDSSVATSTAGPTTSSAESSNFYFEMVEQTVSAAARIIWMSINPKIYWGV